MTKGNGRFIRMNNQRGFTLLELTTSIVIIGILAAVAVPKMADLTSQAKAAKCEANRAALESAAAMAFALNTVAGDPKYPDNIDELKAYMKSGYTAACTITGTLTYTAADGSVSCAEHEGRKGKGKKSKAKKGKKKRH